MRINVISLFKSRFSPLGSTKGRIVRTFKWVMYM